MYTFLTLSPESLSISRFIFKNSASLSVLSFATKLTPLCVPVKLTPGMKAPFLSNISLLSLFRMCLRTVPPSSDWIFSRKKSQIIIFKSEMLHAQPPLFLLRKMLLRKFHILNVFKCADVIALCVSYGNVSH